MERRAKETSSVARTPRVAKAVFQKDDYTCQSCGARSRAGDPVYLHAHHVRRVADEPSAAYDIDNGLTLCVDCHRTLHWGADRKRKSKKAIRSAAD